MEYKLTMEYKLAELHQLVSFVSRKRVHIENNMQFLDTYGMFRFSRQKCAEVFLDEDFFIDHIESDKEENLIDDKFVDNSLELFFMHNEHMNKIIEVMQTANQEEKYEVGHFRLNDAMEDLLRNDGYEYSEESLKEIWEELKLN